MAKAGDTVRRAWRRLPLSPSTRASLRALAARLAPSLASPAAAGGGPDSVFDALSAFPPSPAPEILRCADRRGYEALVRGAEADRRLAFERSLAERGVSGGWWALRGACAVCGAPRLFRVDLEGGGTEREGVVHPNWRERLVCEGCGLNNRQRLAATLARERLGALPSSREPAEGWVMEQVTPFFRALGSFLPAVRWTGSEYLGPGRRPGETVGGVRHEDAESLSFPGGSFDLVVSNDVLEHVPSPRTALGEIFRVLRPGGSLLATIPFHSGLDASRRRAEISDGRVRHLLEPAWHGNPLSPEGSLVFTDFGWDFLDHLREAGFDEVGIDLCWSPPFGHLGGLQPVFSARRPYAAGGSRD
jgi:SAM-dependent methyltransferase